MFEYQNEKISSIFEIRCGTKVDVIHHVYMFEKIEDSCISCVTIDDLRAILKNHFVCIWMKVDKKYCKVQFIKLDQPDQVLYEKGNKDFHFGPFYKHQPVFLDIIQNDSATFKNQ